MDTLAAKRHVFQPRSEEKAKEKLYPPSELYSDRVHMYLGILVFFYSASSSKKTKTNTHLVHIQRHMQAIRKCHLIIKARGSDIISERKDMSANQEPEGKQNKAHYPQKAQRQQHCMSGLTVPEYKVHKSSSFRPPSDATCPQCGGRPDVHLSRHA